MLNRVETAWGVMGAELPREGLRPADEVFRALQTIWDDLGLSTANRLAACFEHRLRMVVEADGNTISEVLPSHMQTRPQDVRECMVHPARSGITIGLSTADVLGRRWPQIVQEMGFSVGRSPLEHKWR